MERRRYAFMYVRTYGVGVALMFRGNALHDTTPEGRVRYRVMTTLFELDN